MLRLYRLLTEALGGIVEKHREFIFTTLARLLAVLCFVIAILLCRRCMAQISMP